MNVPIFGFSGKMAAGKDTAVKHVVERYDGYRIGFADKLKQIAAEMFPRVGDFVRNSVSGIVTKDIQKDDYARFVLQDLGVKLRDIDADVWVRYALNDARFMLQIPDSGTRTPHRYVAPQFVAISDVRFPNEADAIRAAGGAVIRLECREDIRQSRIARLYPHTDPKRLTHISETALDGYDGFAAVVDSTSEGMMLRLDALFAETFALLPAS